MLSAHSILRDRMRRRAVALDLALFAVAIALCATALLDPAVLDSLHIHRERARIALGVLALAAFFLSLAQWRVDWKDMASRHAAACNALAALKAECRQWKVRYEAGERSSPGEIDAWFANMDGRLGELQPIPDCLFASLKASHKRKIEVSRLLDRYPTAPLMLVRLKLAIRHIRGLLRAELRDVADEHSTTR